MDPADSQRVLAEKHIMANTGGNMLDLTPQEVVRLVQALSQVPDGMVVSNENDELTFWINDPHTISMLKKINTEGEREEVKTYLDKYFGHEPEPPAQLGPDEPRPVEVPMPPITHEAEATPREMTPEESEEYRKHFEQ